MEWDLVGRSAETEMIVRALAADRSLLLTGPTGVGKSRLAEEAGRALSDTHHIEGLIGSRGLRELPFAAVAHLGRDAELPDPAVFIRFLTRTVQNRAGGKLIVVVDDIDQLDDGSLGFVHHLTTHADVPVLATARTTGAAEPRIVGLWKDGRMQRVDLEPLSRPHTEELIAAILGGRATIELHNEIWRLSEGHPLYVRELLLEALESEMVSEVNGIWNIASELATSRRVGDIVSMRTQHLGAEELAGLRAIGLCEPVHLAEAKRFADSSVLESLEAKQLIRVESTTHGAVLRSSHPMVAEVTLAAMPTLARASLTAKLARILLDTPSLSPSDAMRAALWLLDAGERAPQEVCIAGARAALRSFDADIGARLAEAALADGPSQEATVLLGRAMTASGNGSAAVSTLQDAQEQATTEAELAAATIALAELNMFNLGDPARAARELEKALEGVQEPGVRAELSSNLMLAAGVVGDFDLGMRIGPEAADDLDLPEAAQLGSVMAMTLTQSITGKLDGVDERLDRGEVLANRLAEMQPFARDQVGMNRLLVLQALGDVTAHQAYGDAALRSGDTLPGPLLFVRSMVCQFTGDIALGRRLTAESEDHLAEMDPLGLEPMAHAMRAFFEAMAGDHDKPAELLAIVRDDPRSAATRVAVWADRAEAWTMTTTDIDAASAAAVEAGRRAVAGTHYVWAAYAFHDAVRFGRPAVAQSELRALANSDRGPLVRLLAEHAHAATAGEVNALTDLAAEFESMTMYALAAEAYAAAALATTDSTNAAQLALLAHRLFSRCDGLVSPLLDTVESPLTDRQEEIAALAAVGETSKTIAEQLHLSSRTVDNHLRSVYRILGVDGRSQLTHLFTRG